MEGSGPHDERVLDVVEVRTRRSWSADTGRSPRCRSGGRCRSLVAAERRVEGHRAVHVDPHRAGLELARHAMGAANVQRPDAGGEAEAACRWRCATASSSSSNGMTDSTGPKTSFWAMKLLRRDVGEDGRREEEAVGQAVGIGALAAIDHLGAVGHGALATMLSSLSSCARAGDRAHLRGRVERVADLDRRRRASPARSSTSSCILRWTSAREPATQVWPAAAKMPASSPASACFRSASANTMLALLPPSSSVTWASGERRRRRPRVRPRRRR